jgi:hypothetical protein
MSKRIKAIAALTGAALVAGTAGWAGTGRVPPEETTHEPAMQARYTVVIPRSSYQAIVISPRDSGPSRAGESRAGLVPFIIRTRDAEGRVSDFPFFVRVGDVHTMTFPSGWTPPTEAALFAPEEASFAAWGVTVGSGASGGQTIRFEPIARDPDRDNRDRDRARDFEEFLREVKRNR